MRQTEKEKQTSHSFTPEVGRTTLLGWKPSISSVNVFLTHSALGYNLVTSELRKILVCEDEI